ncbi:hypothetical protein AB833_05955 [Chromatiales bacterium (ex Bugula neritina AB1)]|nr:hypothetical protein AB833_05955 [Chromatiales bacterium (ex Bugula neritina AB1)]
MPVLVFHREHRTDKKRLINARGPFSPLGVSRSPATVATAVASSLLDFADVSALQDEANETLKGFSGSEAGTVVHCAAAGITLAVASVMTGSDPIRISALPDTTGFRDRVVLPACHAVNYGHPIEQAIRLSGATPILVGDEKGCPTSRIVEAIQNTDTSCLFLVESRLATGTSVDLREAIEAAHEYNIPVVVDGAAQFFRVREIINMGADILIVSAQKYLAAPTAGLIFGRSDLVDGVRAQEKGIGRGMKATKECLSGVLEAIRQWDRRDETSWAYSQAEKVSHFNYRLNHLDGVTSINEPDPTNAPFSRSCLKIDAGKSGLTAVEIVSALRNGSPPIWVMDHRVSEQEIILELIPLDQKEVDIVVARIVQLLS